MSSVYCRYTGSGLFNRLSLSFGYLNKQGYCSRSNSKNCHQFPVVIGETGTTFALLADQQQMADFALYLNNQGAGNDGQHNAISSWFWWAWNANSGRWSHVLLMSCLYVDYVMKDMQFCNYESRSLHSIMW